MDPNAAFPGSTAHPEVSDPSSKSDIATNEMPTGGGHMMAADDPDNPQNWPLYKKIYASAVAFAFTWVV
ncbi:hypothetical protein P7C71_g1515, partial [Lecanoromycetidae sp. Uapishka_2]